MHSLIDTHSHIYVDRFADDRDEVVARARAAGVEAIIVPATNPTEFDAAIAAAARYAEVRLALGIHPHHAAEVSPAEVDAVEQRAVAHGAVAIGEIGLDYHYDIAPRNVQHDVFRRQLRIAKRLDLPAVIHNRESDDDLLRIIDEEQDGMLRFQLHCFSSGADVLERALALGALISFTGNITYPKSTLDDIVRLVPDDRIMIETDAPYLTPAPYRGKRNEPAYVGLVAERVAQIRETSLEIIQQMTTDNARRFFRLAALLILLLPLCTRNASAQREPVREFDTTTKPMFDKWVGIGGHVAFSSYITGATTEADGIVGSGIWLSLTPLQALKVDWLQLDLIYTHVVNRNTFDSAFLVTTENITPRPGTPPNVHNQIDISLRAIANARNVISLYGALGLTYFHNEFGADQYLSDHFPDLFKEGYAENAWGLGGSLGLSLNFNTPYGLISPTAEWRVAKIMSARPLPKRQQEFFVSQPRIGLLIYPALGKLF